MKKLLSIILLTLPTILLGQETKLNFNYSFHGDYNPPANDYSSNMKVDSTANISFYINQEKLVVTSNSDTLFNHYIVSIENDEDGYTTYSTTNYIYEAVFMYHEEEGVTMLYQWSEQSEQVRMHYKHKYFWANR